MLLVEPFLLLFHSDKSVVLFMYQELEKNRARYSRCKQVSVKTDET